MAIETTQNETESEGLEDRQQSIAGLWGNPTPLIHAQPQPPKKRDMRRQNKILEIMGSTAKKIAKYIQLFAPKILKNIVLIVITNTTP